MIITLSADKEMLDKSRECAARRGMSLGGMFRDFLQRVLAEPKLYAGVRACNPFQLGFAL